VINCENCEEPVPGEPGECPDCSEDWDPGDWYIDGKQYTCPACGTIHEASADGEFAELNLLCGDDCEEE
jgi:hypothetical protein